jgi:hypothetical protein
MASDRAELAAARMKSARLRVEQLRERIARLSAGVASTPEDVAIAKACAENQRNEMLKAQERLRLTYAAANQIHRAPIGLPDPTSRPRDEAEKGPSDGPKQGGGNAAIEEARSDLRPATSELNRPRPGRDDKILQRLSWENRLLRSALVAFAASTAGEGNGVWSKDRRRKLWQALVDQCGEDAWQGWARALCLAAVSILPDLRGAAVSGYDTHRVPYLLAVTDEWTRRAEEIHQLVGEGPAVEAYTSQGPVVVTHLDDEQGRWPGYVAAAEGTDLGGICALPVKLNGVTLGSITLYSRHSGDKGWQEWLDGSFLAAAAAKALLADLDAIDDGLQFGDPGDERIQVATGMLAVQLDLGIDEALARMRAFAFSNARGLAEVAEAIVDGSLRLP